MKCFKAYKKWMEENGEEDILEGINYVTHVQLFYLSFAQVYIYIYIYIYIYVCSTTLYTRVFVIYICLLKSHLYIYI